MRLRSPLRTPRGALAAKLCMAAMGFWAIWVLRGPWWYVAYILLVLCYMVADALRAYRREAGFLPTPADAPLRSDRSAAD